MRTAGIVFFSVLLTMVQALADDGDKPLSTTIEKIVADPVTPAFKHVVVEGQIDNCNYWYCELCPAAMTTETYDKEKCLEMLFESPGDHGTADEQIQAQMGEMYRFATVRLEAFFDPNCRVTYKDQEIICIHRVIDLNDAHVVAVLSRKTSNDGLVGDDEIYPVSPAGPRERDAMQAGFAIDGKATMLKDPEFFLISPRIKRRGDERWFALSDHTDAQGLACVCVVEEGCAGRWPTRFFNGISSPANPFLCRKMAKSKAGDWRVVVDGAAWPEWGFAL